MNMKQKLLMGLVAATLTAPVFADTAGDTQSVTGIVDPVALLDIRGSGITARDADDQTDDVTLSLTTEPTIAGLNFTTQSTATVTGAYDLSSNIAAGGTNNTARTVTVYTALPKGWKLTLAPASFSSGGASASASAITPHTLDLISGDSGTSGDPKVLLSTIQNIATGTTPPALTWTLSPESTNILPSYTSETGTVITLNYSLTADI